MNGQVELLPLPDSGNLTFSRKGNFLETLFLSHRLVKTIFFNAMILRNSVAATLILRGLGRTIVADERFKIRSKDLNFLQPGAVVKLYSFKIRAKNKCTSSNKCQQQSFKFSNRTGLGT
ncbi:conserved hypothetical protein [Ricinus communis]|uniref:Uncharacterized protein n=1 Tax=Ricinus communis TaxID=3988 RepID=B9SGJ5_RICCO|nr:conserved hypothetical protein [Ricinus communis]